MRLEDMANGSWLPDQQAYLFHQMDHFSTKFQEDRNKSGATGCDKLVGCRNDS